MSPDAGTPLHIASMLGDLESVSEILAQKPELALELDSQRSTPLHHAAAKGYSEIAKKLLTVNPDVCFLQDKYGRNPLHVAAIKGQLDVLKEMARVRPRAAQKRMQNGDTILHLCVRYNNLECLKVVVEILSNQNLLNFKNDDGSTILHLAAAPKQHETVNFLLKNTTIEANSTDKNGLTAFEILAQAEIPVKEKEITEDYAFSGAGIEPVRNVIRGPSSDATSPISAYPLQRKRQEKHSDGLGDWVVRKRDALMVVASLIATMAFQAGVNPPGGVWQDTSQGDAVSGSHTAGFSIMADNYPVQYTRFLAYNTTGFIASLSIILLLMSGLPLRHRLFMWVLTVIIWIAITAIAMTYLISISTFTPDHEKRALTNVLGFVILVWMLLMALLLLGHTIRLIIKMVKRVRKTVKKRKNSSFTVSSHSGI